jgi:hypothetical protein
MAQVIRDIKAKQCEEPFSNFEKNITAREVKPPSFGFVVKDDKVLSVSFSGRDAANILASREECDATNRRIPDLYENVWKDEVVPQTDTSAVHVIKALGYAHLFNKNNDGVEPGNHILYADAAELLRRSLRDTVAILRSPAEYVFTSNKR